MPCRITICFEYNPILILEFKSDVKSKSTSAPGQPKKSSIADLFGTKPSPSASSQSKEETKPKSRLSSLFDPSPTDDKPKVSNFDFFNV